MKRFSSLVTGNNLDALLQVNALVEQYCRLNQAPPELEQTLLLLCEEVFANIVNHAYTDSAEHFVEISIYHNAQRVRLEFKDDGFAFNPLQQQQAELGLPVAEAPVGGLGLTMIRRLSDELRYQRAGKYNILSLACNTKQSSNRQNSTGEN
jgi:anti-sigma regulatory factor (Ser/Thr protein kinase)